MYKFTQVLKDHIKAKESGTPGPCVVCGIPDPQVTRRNGMVGISCSGPLCGHTSPEADNHEGAVTLWNWSPVLAAAQKKYTRS